jgi:hypothetical protein
MGKISSFLWTNGRAAFGHRRAAWLVLSACCWLATGSPAQAGNGNWQWLDSQGRRIFSDLPPPTSVPDQRILQRPGPELPGPGLPTPKDSSPASPAGDQSLGKAPEPLYQRNAAALRENCRHAKATLATLASGLRLHTLDEKGGQVLMDDAMRARETLRAQQAERDNCEPKAGAR